MLQREEQNRTQSTMPNSQSLKNEDKIKNIQMHKMLTPSGELSKATDLKAMPSYSYQSMI
jgi:hypothetical protein